MKINTDKLMRIGFIVALCGGIAGCAPQSQPLHAKVDPIPSGTPEDIKRACARVAATAWVGTEDQDKPPEELSFKLWPGGSPERSTKERSEAAPLIVYMTREGYLQDRVDSKDQQYLIDRSLSELGFVTDKDNMLIVQPEDYNNLSARLHWCSLGIETKESAQK